MEFLFELIFELIFEGSLEASKNKKLPKVVRYLFIALIILFFCFAIGLILLTGVLLLKENIVAAIFMLLLGLFFLIMSIIKFKKVYLKNNEK